MQRLEALVLRREAALARDVDHERDLAGKGREVGRLAAEGRGLQGVERFSGHGSSFGRGCHGGRERTRSKTGDEGQGEHGRRARAKACDGKKAWVSCAHSNPRTLTTRRALPILAACSSLRKEPGPAPSSIGRLRPRRHPRAARPASRDPRDRGPAHLREGIRGGLDPGHRGRLPASPRPGSTTTSAARSTCCWTSRTTGWTCSRSRSSPR